MKKLVLLFALVGMANTMRSQDLPVLTPPTPNAASLGKSIEIPVSLNTGIPNINIPIWQIKQRNVSIDIGLSYNSSGIKVEEIASWVGTGWNLNFGGGIFRSSRGLPDDVNGGFLNVTGDFVVDSLNHVTLNRRNELLQLALENQIDYQPDIFNFSILGHSGKFFFDQNSKEVLMFSKSDVKIEPVFEFPLQYKNILSWKITLPNGIQCFFGEGNAVESTVGFTFTETRNHVLSGAKNAWYISRIVDNSGDDIIYTYESISKDICKLSSQGESWTPSTGVLSCISDLLPAGQYTVYYRGTSIGARIQQIESSDTKVVFTKKNTQREDYSSDYALDKVEVYHKGNIDRLISTFNFSYHYKTNSSGAQLYPSPCFSPTLDELSKRLFLSSIQQTSGSETLPPYTMHYNSTLLPARTSFAQDYWGYYNGKTNNNTLIPEVYIPNYWNPSGPSLYQSGADRTVDANHTKAGILEKIDYPTGGSTEFTYEGNKASFSTVDFTDFIPSNPTVQDIISVDNSDLVLGDFSTYFVSKTFTVASNSCSDLNVNNKIFVESFYPCDEGRNDCQIIIKLDGQELQSNGTRQCVELTPGQHTLSYVAYHSNIPFGGPEPNFYARVTREYIDGGANPIIEAGGLRIKEIKKNPIDNNPIIKGYEYFDGWVLNMPIYGSKREGFFRCCELIGSQTACQTYESITYEKRSNSSTPLLNANGSYVMYRNVHEYTKDVNGNKNGVAKSNFSFTPDGVNRTFPFGPHLSLEWKRGNLLKTEYFSIDQNNIEKKVSEITYLYDYKDRVSEVGVFPYRRNLGDAVANPFSADYFSTEGESKILIGQTRTDFFDGINKTKRSTFYYDNPLHLQRTRSEIITSKGDTLRTKTFYPVDVVQVNSLGNDNLSNAEFLSIQDLITKNRISEPVQVESYINSELKSTQRTNYKNWGGGIIEPENKEILKGVYNATNNTLEQRVVYHKYDIHGNPLEMSKKDGTHVVFIWGYNHTLPVAKIENATYSEVLSYVANIQNKSNLDNDRTFGSSGNEGQLRIALNNLRNLSALSDAMITTYTYDPLIGVTSMTDPRGNLFYYEYDDLNRLSLVKDQDGNILNENTYNYKN